MQNKHKTYWRHYPIIAFLGVNLLIFFSIMVHSASITSEMSSEVAAEYKKQLDLQPWPQLHTKLGLMDNPYKVFYKKLKKRLNKRHLQGRDVD